MKKLIIVITTLLTLNAYCDKEYELVNDNMGYSYIQINTDLDSFKFTTDFKSIGNSGKVGYFIYPDGLTGDDLKHYIDSFEITETVYHKNFNNNVIELGKLNNGDKIGFYLDRKNGDIVRSWTFETHNGKTYIAFNKNNSKGKDEWMSIDDINFAVSRHDTPPSGQPLPGFVVCMIVGTCFIFFMYYFKKKTVCMDCE